MKKTIIILYFLLISLLMGCEKEIISYKSLIGSFVTSEMLIEVTEKTKSFRIEIEYPPEHPDTLYSFGRPYIFIEKETTTAKHNTHFVNTPTPSQTIGEFWVLEGARKAYKDVTIIPENITEQVVITYSTIDGRIEGSPIEVEGGLFNQLTVILKPKS